MRRFPRRPPAVLLLLALAGCAPIGPYRGVTPAPGALLAFEGGAAPAGAPAPPRAVLVPGSTDAARRHLGDLARAEAGGAVVLLFGDNRPGFRMEANSPAYWPVMRMTHGGLGGFLRGVLWSPVFLVTAIFPTLDGPRDLVTVFSRHPQGGGERRVLEALSRALPADLVLSTGDLVFDGRRGLGWKDWQERVRPLRERVLFAVAPGNHERLYDANASAAWRATVGPPAAADQRWCTLDVPACGARFVLLDSNLLTDAHDHYDDALEHAQAEAQLSWADSALSGPQRFKFVLLHHPPVSSGHYALDWGGGDEGSPAARRRARLLELCASRGVTAVFCGHEHLYQRVWLAAGGGRGFWQITTAGGGAPLYPLDRTRRDAAFARPLPAGLAVDEASALTERTYHYCRLELPAAAVGVATARLVAIRPNGAAIDTLELGSPPAAR